MDKSEATSTPALRVTAPGKIGWNANEMSIIDWSDSDFLVCIHGFDESDATQGATVRIPKADLIRVLRAVEAMERFRDELAF
jgi:hypothetical protein